LDIIEKKYLEASEAYITNSEACQNLIKPGVHPVGPKLAALQQDGIGLSAELHLQIESYYLKRIGFSVVSQLWLLSMGFRSCVGGRFKSGRNLRQWAAFYS
jgi:hypothetical protein